MSSECSHVKRVQQSKSTHETLLVTNLKRIVVGEELVEGLCNIAGPLGKLPRGVRGSESSQNPLVGIDESFKVKSVVAHICHVKQSVLCQLTLHAEEKVLNVAVAAVFGNPGDVVGGRVEGSDQPGWESLIRGDIATWCRSANGDDLRRNRVADVRCCWSRLWNSGELCLRGIDAGDIARAGTRVVDVAGAEATANEPYLE